MPKQIRDSNNNIIKMFFDKFKFFISVSFLTHKIIKYTCIYTYLWIYANLLYNLNMYKVN